MIPVSTTSSSVVKYVEEHERGVELDPGTLEFSTRSVPVSPQEFDVSDPDALCHAAEVLLGEGANDDEWYGKHAMWFVNASANAAVLLVFRPKVAHAQ